MLKIKFNTNELTIIFFEKIGKKINAEKFSVSAVSSFLLQHLFSPFSASAAVFFFFASAFFFAFSFCPFFLKSSPLLVAA